MCERWDFRKGFSVDLPRHKIGSKDYMILQGSKPKTALLSPSFGCTKPPGTHETGGSCALALPAIDALRASAGQETERGRRGDRVDRLTSGGNEGCGRSPVGGEGGACHDRLRNREGKRYGDSMGMTSNRTRERQNGKETT
jgi:hypothetical protein